jgi:hypothetical protein
LTAKKQFIKALSLTSSVNEWLVDSCHPRILHVFDRACNLINERREVLSIVSPQIGNGPFNLVVQEDVLFSEHLTVECSVSMPGNQLFVGDLVINTVNAKPWSSRPNWEVLHAHQDSILNQLTQLPMIKREPSLPASLLSTFCISIANADSESCFAAARRLAGLGIGLTPSGDDFILGAVLAAWIIHPTEIAGVLAEGIANTAAPLTTSLSAAWLRSAGRGEAGILWHEFFDALISSNPVQIQTARDKVLATGETSGADALAGFSGVFACLRKSVTSEIH